MNSIPIQCSCGAVKGSLSNTQGIIRCMCYCADCQAFAQFLERGDDILNERGGTQVIQTSQAKITLSEGKENLACIKLTRKGILRWHTNCCNTPIGNTLPNHKMVFIGLIHNCLYTHPRSIEETFGPIRMHVNPEHAIGEPKPKSTGVLRAAARIILMMLRARLDGSYRQSPFFNHNTGRPVVKPVVLN